MVFVIMEIKKYSQSYVKQKLILMTKILTEILTNEDDNEKET